MKSHKMLLVVYSYGRPRTEYHRLHSITAELVREEVAGDGFGFNASAPRSSVRFVITAQGVLKLTLSWIF